MHITGLSFGYAPTTLFSGFSFHCDAPIIILCGRTGCGKTTLLKLIARLLRPTNVDVFDIPRQCRMILQEDALFPWLSVKRNLSIVCDPGQVKNGVPLLEPIKSLLDRYVFQLSFGQRRLVELCRSLMVPPSLLCLDEPFNFLDLNTRGEVAKLIRSVSCQQTRVIMTTHHQEDIDLFEAPVYRFSGDVPIHGLHRDA